MCDDVLSIYYHDNYYISRYLFYVTGYITIYNITIYNKYHSVSLQHVFHPNGTPYLHVVHWLFLFHVSIVSVCLLANLVASQCMPIPAISQLSHEDSG